MKALLIIAIATFIASCDEQDQEHSCTQLDVELHYQGNNANGPSNSRDRCHYEESSLCLTVSGTSVVENSLWLSTDGTLIRMATTYESIDGWQNVSREPEYSMCVDYTYLSDSYCSQFRNDAEQCKFEGCVVSNVDVVTEQNSCSTTPNALCVYDVFALYTGEYVGAICSQDSSEVAFINSDGIPTGWDKCDTPQECSN